jgi:glutamate-ammonia-ligase adenylyltransferase
MLADQPALTFEDVLDRMRDAARQENFLVAAQLLSGVRAPEQAGAAFADVADAVTQTALAAAERDMAATHGRVAGARAAVLGLGRLGMRDLTATSDLDLLILYDAPDMEARSDGARPLDAVTWHQRLAQRLITALTAPTRRGALYDVDLRLRPAGGKGPLAVRLDSFRAYQTDEAELWEHMALTKARAVAGDETLLQAAMAEVRAVVARTRDAAAVRRDVRAMRARIAEAKGDADPWDLKLARGGLTDLDFIAEALILQHAAAHPRFAGASTLQAIRAAGEAGLITARDAAALEAAGRLLNDVTHWLRLTCEGDFSPAATPAPVIRMIAAAAQAVDLPMLTATLAETHRTVREAFERLLT